MEKFAYFCICFVAIMALVMIVLVIIAVLKVSSEQDDERDLYDKIRYQTEKGLSRRDDTAEALRMERTDTHPGRVEQDSRNSERNAVFTASKVPMGSGAGAYRTDTEEQGQTSERREVHTEAEER